MTKSTANLVAKAKTRTSNFSPAAALQTLGYLRAAHLDGGLEARRAASRAVAAGS